jgi:hypothetical protein
MPVSPTNMWCASSVSMKRVVRASGSKPLSASASSWYLPSRSVKYVNMKNCSQSVHGRVEGAEDARLVGVAAAALEQGLGLLAAVATEVRVQQVDHRPQVAALLHVDLEEVAEVVQAGAGLAEQALLLDAGRLGVALGDDQAAERVAVLAGHLLPHGLPMKSPKPIFRSATGSARKMPQR